MFKWWEASGFGISTAQTVDTHQPHCFFRPRVGCRQLKSLSGKPAGARFGRWKHSEQHQLAPGLTVEFWRALPFAILCLSLVPRDSFHWLFSVNTLSASSNYSLVQMEGQVWTCNNIVGLFFLITTKIGSPEKCCWKSACWDASIPHTILMSVVETQLQLLGAPHPWRPAKESLFSLAGNDQVWRVFPQKQPQPWTSGSIPEDWETLSVLRSGVRPA